MKMYSFLPILALLLGMAASAFTTSKPTIENTNPLWHFTGTTVQQQSDPDLYEPTDEQTLPGCDDTEVYCVIEAPEDINRPGFPDLSNVQGSDIKSLKAETP